ncbi:coproporphyrinogen III oxidase, O2-independent, SAM and NAD(P)H dependent, putative [Luminiphilus syltensis NOR5-1B]|uniref:Oxygen-independent coproporphyrinogen III oxidase n=1 Tax=Luminiphilus syltensis NOR5-1B TaxID=565045 RepID=B8KT30_9GAMM|nr:radical SAM protein [Luminiphilus syltensis]EED36211.1 coproporphyrinogen III oxidase, O2-independent, SAM and NAD(P)H dependent, putative [Luminiphilus syltensis NOR5-1B]
MSEDSGKTNKQLTNDFISQPFSNKPYFEEIGKPMTQAQFVALANQQLSADVSTPLRLYVHVPFCSSKCFSCSRSSTVPSGSGEIEAYLDMLDLELAAVASQVENPRALDQIHLGGGTPNLLSEAQLLRLVSSIEKHFLVTDDTEMSLAANPNRVSSGQLALLNGLGFDRIRFEVRDVNETVQRSLGRFTTAEMLSDVFDSARQAGFQRITTDTLYGLPSQTIESVAESARAIAELGPDRVICKAFERRPDLYPNQRNIVASGMPSLADRLVMFQTIADTFNGAGFEWVGLDCFMTASDPVARAAKDSPIYRGWDGYALGQRGVVLGVGASAFSELGDVVVQNTPNLKTWQDTISTTRHPARMQRVLSHQDQLARDVLEGVFTSRELSDIEMSWFNAETGVLPKLKHSGVVALEGNRVSFTDNGKIVLRQMFSGLEPLYGCAPEV